MSGKLFLLVLLSAAAAGGALATANPSNQAAGSPPVAPVVTVSPSTQSQAAVKLVVASNGNTARYRVRERLVGFDLPNDAVGETQSVSGAVALDKAGVVIPGESRITVNVAGLKSDKERRDGYLQGRTLETSKFPSVDLVVTRINGLSLPLPTSGTRKLVLEGTLTIKGVSRPTSWNVEATFSESAITGTAVTRFTFKDFELNQPSVPVVLSVSDSIGLEYDFTLQR
jgi:polyisoprenoid-binding protein YceI